MGKRDGSDLHLKVPSRPLARINGQLLPLEYYDPMRPEDTERVLQEMLAPPELSIASLQFVKHCARLGDLMASRDTCPVCATAEVVCGKWTLLVIRDLAEGRSRFCELERSLQGISPRTLSLRLRALEEEGIVERQTFPEVPPRVEYALTEKGRALVPLIEDMRAYGLQWLLGAGYDDEDARRRAARRPRAADRRSV